MTLKDYINFRERGNNKNTLYNRRTQHFYDGRPMIVKDGGSMAYATGIEAAFMNDLRIPDAYAIASEQKKQFLSLTKSKSQKKLLIKLNELSNPAAFAKANIEINQLLSDSIKSLEEGFDKVLSSVTELKKIKKHNSGIALENAAYEALNDSYRNFFNIYTSIIQKRPVLATEQYVKQLDEKLNYINAMIDADPKILLKKELITHSKKKESDYISYLAYLIAQVKGVSMLEHQGINFIKNCVEIPEDIEFIGSGQILVGGKQASQDALFFDKKLQIVLDNGKRVELKKYLEDNQEKEQRISFSLAEWNQIQTKALGLQSKYHRGGYIAMGRVKFEDVINLDMNEAKALRNLYILSRGLKGYATPGGPLENVSHKFNVRASHEHYKALFSYCMGKFMGHLMSHNYFMMTARGVMDSYSYYVDLFNRGRYFAPIGTVSVTQPKEYRVAIKEN